MKILCEKCYQELEQTHHADATYVVPCSCAAGREAEVAYAAAELAIKQTEWYFSELVEEAIGESMLDGTDNVEDLQTLDKVLIKIVSQETEAGATVDINYEDLDV